MTSVAGPEEADYGARLGFSHGLVVQELGQDDDVDDSLRKSVEEAVGDSLVSDDHPGTVDVVLLWLRQADGDLVDILAEAADPLSPDGHIWVLTPNPGKPGHLEPGDIEEAASAAGLSQTDTVAAGPGPPPEWFGPRRRARPGRGVHPTLLAERRRRKPRRATKKGPAASCGALRHRAR
ncbi:DUF3052 domain-containing protein [Streptomyces exfoliatus]|uniref:DUF3052 domain-containing protein n=1 Tax=Streptomyces exfoliatus TaxID=1905 RepID=UPI003C2CDACD